MMDYSSILNSRINSVAPSGIRKFFDLLEDMPDAISLGVGEPDFPTPWHIRDAGIFSLEKGFTRYSPNAGLSELRREIAKYLKRRFDLTYDAKSEVLVTVGGSEGLDLALRCMLELGDEVIIPTPSFVCYGPLVSLAGGTPVYMETRVEDEFRITPRLLKQYITPKTKVLVLPYPCNPTGGVMERSDLEAIAPIIQENNLMVISDEIYAELTYAGLHHTSIANLPGMWERTLLVNGFSKAYSMTGWRMGYLCGPAPLIKGMVKLHQYGIMSAPTTSQYAAIEAMKNGDEDIESMKAEYDARRQFLFNGFRDMGLECFEPKGAFYMFPCIKSTGLNSDQFCEDFLKAKEVAVIPGSAFGPGGEGFVRCCYAASMHELAIALERMEDFIKHR